MKNIKEINESEFQFIDNKYDCIILNTNFHIEDLNNLDIIDENNDYIKESIKLVNKCCNLLENGGLFFIYGLPKYLPFLGNFLNNNLFNGYHFLFKYWIALEYCPKMVHQPLRNSHFGLLMYLKTKLKKSPTPFRLNTKTVRVPYSSCPSCGEITKDWGGKKHLLNPLGAAISDVWSYPEIHIKDHNKIPLKVKKRIFNLMDKSKNKMIVMYQDSETQLSLPKKNTKKAINKPWPRELINKVIKADSIKLMNDLYKDFPNGLFDLVFADPPYNLEKNYSRYDDEINEKNYIRWCNEWLEGMNNILKPGGALLVVNLPKWAIYHSVFLSKFMHFRHWIVWDALSTPAGKFLPAHYALLYFTKPGKDPKSNFAKLKFIDNRKYCLRSSCIKKRKLIGDDDKEILSDVWRDIHRIKHKKDRDRHPCQLPINLMKRIIELFTDEGDLIYDPFGGTGTTAIAAKITKRNFIISDIDEHYVQVARDNVYNIKSDIFGQFEYKRESVSNKKNENIISKKLVETSYLNLCFKEQRVLSLDEVKQIDKGIYFLLKNYTGSFRKLENICMRKFETNSLFK